MEASQKKNDKIKTYLEGRYDQESGFSQGKDHPLCSRYGDSCNFSSRVKVNYMI